MKTATVKRIFVALGIGSAIAAAVGWIPILMYNVIGLPVQVYEPNRLIAIFELASMFLAVFVSLASCFWYPD